MDIAMRHVFPILSSPRVRCASLLLCAALLTSCGYEGGGHNAAMASGRTSPELARGCPDWSAYSAANVSNADHSNLGCATHRNLSEMVADPEDFIRGSGDHRTYGDRTAQAIQTYRSGAASGSSSGSSASGSESSASGASTSGSTTSQ